MEENEDEEEEEDGKKWNLKESERDAVGFGWVGVSFWVG